MVVHGEADSKDGRSVDITDVVFTTVGSAAGAIVVEWNVGRVEHREPPGGLSDSSYQVGFDVLRLMKRERFEG